MPLSREQFDAQVAQIIALKFGPEVIMAAFVKYVTDEVALCQHASDNGQTELEKEHYLKSCYMMAVAKRALSTFEHVGDLLQMGAIIESMQKSIDEYGKQYE